MSGRGPRHLHRSSTRREAALRGDAAYAASFPLLGGYLATWWLTEDA
jgi:hypothetical protein